MRKKRLEWGIYISEFSRTSIENANTISERNPIRWGMSRILIFAKHLIYRFHPEIPILAMQSHNTFKSCGVTVDSLIGCLLFYPYKWRPLSHENGFTEHKSLWKCWTRVDKQHLIRHLLFLMNIFLQTTYSSSLILTHSLGLVAWWFCKRVLW